MVIWVITDGIYIGASWNYYTTPRGDWMHGLVIYWQRSAQWQQSKHKLWLFKCLWNFEVRQGSFPGADIVILWRGPFPAAALTWPNHTQCAFDCTRAANWFYSESKSSFAAAPNAAQIYYSFQRTHFLAIEIWIWALDFFLCLSLYNTTHAFIWNADNGWE